jgi:hypothetical protein
MECHDPSPKNLREHRKDLSYLLITKRHKESQWLAFEESIGQFYAMMGRVQKLSSRGKCARYQNNRRNKG